MREGTGGNERDASGAWVVLLVLPMEGPLVNGLMTLVEDDLAPVLSVPGVEDEEGAASATAPSILT